jgi:trans-2,3-dihydro-3-hydroxyanthranilate isomerase
VTHRFLQVDAFSVRPFEGNACAVILDADDLADETMQLIAREMNLSETAFVVSTDRADIGIRRWRPCMHSSRRVTSIWRPTPERVDPLRSSCPPE